MNRGFEILPEFKDKVTKLEADLGISFIPQRATKGSSGYDIRTIEDVILQPGEIIMVPTGLTAKMLGDEELQLRGRLTRIIMVSISSSFMLIVDQIQSNLRQEIG